MLLSLKEGIPVGMNSTVDELVENTLFNTYNEQIQDFLLKLSVMDDFTDKQACLDQKDKIPYWLQIGDMSTSNFLYQGMAFNYIIYGKAVMLSENYINLEMLLENFVEYFSIFSNQLGFIHNGIFKAIAKYHLYGMKEGVSALQEILSKTQIDNIIMPFVENSSHIMDMLNIIENNDSSNKYIKKVIYYSKQYSKSLNTNKLEKISLSQREVEVLSLIAKGLKRDEVALHLTMSQGTVRTHLQHIYEKLGASGKIAAIKSAQMNGINLNIYQ